MLLLLAATLPAAFAYNFESGGIYYNITGVSPNTVAVTYATGSYNSYSGTVDIPGTVTYNGTTYTVTAIGNSAFRSCSNLTGVTIPNTVTSIGEYAFSSCSHITSVTIPNGVETIGVRAFYNCSQLSTLTILNGVEIIGASAFYHCNLHTVTIPASVTSIGSDAFSCSNLDSVFFKATNCSSAANAFENCSHLTYLNIGSNVQTIPANIFAYCNALRSIYIPSSVSTIGTNPFHHCHGLDTIIVEEENSVYTSGNHYNAIIHSATHTLVTGCKSTVIPNSVTQIGGYAFAGCTGLTGPYTIPNQIIVIGASAYSDCTSLTSLTIGHNVDSIGNSAFSGCSAISSVAFNADSCRYMGAGFSSCNSFSTLAIGNNVKAIPAYAFRGCSHLTGMLVIPDSVKTIGEYAFNGCSGLTLLSIGNSVTSIGNSAFYSCNEMGGTLTIPQSVKSIGSSAFYNCPGFTSLVFNADSCATGSFSRCSNVSTLTIGDNVKIIPESAFSGLSLITGTLTLPSTLMYIGGSAFSNCSGLTGLIAIPDSVQAIGSYAFQNCSGLTSLTIGKAVSNIGSYAFQNCSGLASIAFNADSCVSMGIGSNDNPVFSGCTNAATLSIGENVKTIPAYAFYNLTGLTGPTTIPDSVQNIGHYAFKNCSGLTSLTIGEAVSTIGGYAFQNCSGLSSIAFNADSCFSMGSSYSPVFSGCTNAATLSIGENVKTIPAYAFYNFTGLAGAITIPNSVQSIGDYAFQNCIGLTHVTFNADSCTYMGFYNPYHGGYDGSVFKGCDSLSTLILGENVKNIPDYAFFNCSKLNGKLTFSRVTLIGTSAFEGCSELDSLIIGRTVSSIGTYAFKNCIGLSYVEYNADSCNSSGHLFTGCTAPASLVIGENVKSIPDYCFRNFTGLSGTLVIPDSVKVIGFSAFSECTGLDSVIIGKSVASMGNAFNGCSGLSYVEFNADSCIDDNNYYTFNECDSLSSLTIGNNVKIIPNDMFRNRSSLTGCINIPNSVKTIGEEAFFNCNSIDSLIIGKSVTSIGSDAFENCSGLSHVVFNADSCTAVGINLVSGSIGGTIFNGCTLTSTLVIGDNVKNIPQNIFYGLSGLQGTLVIPDSVVFIGSCAFKNCSNLTNLVIGKSVREIQPGYNAQYSAFAGCGGITSLSFNADSCIVAGNANYPAFKVLSNLTTLSIGDNVKVIPDYAFSNSKLTGELVIPNSVKYIGRSAFEWCNKLNGALIIPNSVKTIEDNAFKWTNFDSLVIGKNVSLIDTGAFTGCSHLKHVSYNADSCSCAEGISNRPFSNCDSIVSLTISDNVKIIPAYVFNGLNHITGELTIPDSVKIIGTRAFANCTGISKLILSRSVDSLGASAFANCTGINSIFSYNKTPPAPALNSSNPFDNVGRNFFVHVPCGTADAYRAAWRYNQNVSSSYFNYYADDLQPYLFTVLSDDTIKGTVQITTQPTCTSPAVIEAMPNFFYVFDHWSDGNTDNPRTLTLTQDTTLVAHFREYDLNISCDTNYGHIVFLQMPTAENPQAVVQVVPNPCYLFGYWTDYKHSGSSVWSLNEEYDNPRTITLSQDTTMEVSFRYAHPVDISSDRTSLCEGDSTVLKGVTYPEAWSGNTAIPSNSVTEGFLWVRYIPTGSGTYQRDTLGLEDSIVVSTAGIYRVMGIDSTGCIAYSTISMEVHPYPTIMISGETEICAGNSTTLTAGLYEFSEDFTNGIPTEWTTNGDALDIYTLNGNSGNAILFPAYDLPENTEAELILPDINLKQFDQPSIGFKIAYYGRLSSCHDVWNSTYPYWQNICDTIRNEDLKIMLSTDGGITWTEVYRASNDYSYYDYQWYVSENAYYPQNMSNSHGGWANLSNFSDYENVKIKFVFTGGQGNNMWLDDIQLYSGIYDYNLSYLWSNGGENSSQTFDDSGTYYVTVSNRIGSYWDAMQENWIQTKCSTTDSVTITVWEPSDTTEVTVNTPESYYVMNGETFCTSGDYTQTLQNIHGCDSVVKLHLTLTPSITVVNDTVYGKYRYSTANTYINIYGTKESYQYKMTPDQYAHWADSVLTDWLDWSEMDSTYIHLSYDSITNMASMNFEYVNVYRRLDGNVYRDEFFYLDNTYTDSSFYDFSDTLTLQTSVGCDSTIIWNTRIFFRDYVELHDLEECSFTWQGDSLFITDPIYQETVVGGIGYGDTLTESGTYLQKLINTNGCDSTVHLSLTIHPAVYEEITITACDSCILNGVTYMESGDYIQNTDTMFTTIRKMIYISWRGWGYTDIYGNFVAFWPNGWSGIEWNIDPETNTVVSYSYFDQFGIEHPYVMGDTIPYTDTMPACKLTTLHLTINPSVTELVEATACDSYTWNDSIYTTSGEYIQTFTAANGCDSTVTLQLTINESKHTDTTAESCGSYTWNETTYTTSGEYFQTFTAANGCDSTVTLHLTILPLPTPNITGVTTVCEGQTATLNATGGVSYLWEDGTTTNTYPATVSGFYTVTVTNAEGCSATASATVTVNPHPEVAITGNTAICPGGSTVLTATGADSYQWSNGSTNPSIPVNMFGQYSVIGTSSAGCFSTASVTVLVSQPPVITISGNTDICAGESTTLTANGGVSYMWSNGSTADTLVATTAGTWQVIGYNADGCSNMASVTVNVWQPASSDLYITAFDSCYMWFGTPRCESGNYTYTLQTIHGCDSVITLHLTLEDAITTEFNATSCDSYTWNGATYTVSGNYTQSFTAVNGNDSIVTLHLTINNPVHTATTAESCSSYDWNGQTYTVSGDYTYEHLDANGCTQVDTLHLTIFNPVHTAITAGSCGSYYWNGQTYTESGDYTYEHLDANGCTQVDTLHLTVNDTKHVEFADSTCTAYTWNGQTYASSGNYTQTLTAANGCDSVVTLHLTIVPTITPAIAVTGSLTACDNGSATLSVPGNYSNFVWSTGAITPTITVSEAGYYWVTATDAFGCEGVSEMVQLGGSTQIDETPAICMVDVEDNHNLLIWEELSDPDVASYHIYRENNQANVFEPLAVIPAGSVNAFADSTADPSVRAWRYKITAADTCGGETPMSGYHKTVHLTINQGLDNSWNLIWTPYEGLEFASYKLYRGTANNNLQLIQTMPATLTSYTDNNPSGDALFYQIEVVMTDGCVQHTRDITHTGARSNIVYNQVPVMAEETVSACESYDWNGQTLTSSGDYTQTFVSELGYDSVVTLHLTIHHTPVFSISGNLAISQGQSTALSVPNNAGWSYLWNTGETASVIIVAPSETTSYSVTVTEGTCNASDSVTVTVNTGIDDHDGFDFTVYPNPTTNIVNVQCTMNNVQFSGTEIHIVDMYGKLVRTKPFDGETTLIDISDLANGIYFVKAVADGNVVAVRKVEKQ